MQSPRDNDLENTSSFQVQDPALFRDAPSERLIKISALLLQVALAVSAAIWFGLLATEIRLASFAETGTPAWNATYDATQLTHTAAIWSAGATLVLLICWITLSYGKLDAIGNASENPRLVLLSWLIPIVNLLIPARVLEEISVGGDPESYDSVNPRLAWSFWLTGPTTFVVRLALGQIEPLLFTSGRLSTTFTALEWATALLLSTAGLVGFVVVRRSTRIVNQ